MCIRDRYILDKQKWICVHNTKILYFEGVYIYSRNKGWKQNKFNLNFKVFQKTYFIKILRDKRGGGGEQSFFEEPSILQERLKRYEKRSESMHTI